MIDFVELVERELTQDETLPEPLKQLVRERARTIEVEPATRSRLFHSSHFSGPKNAVNTNDSALLRGGGPRERAREINRSEAATMD